MTYTTLAVTHEGPVTWLTLNRPESLNALNSTMVTELRDFFSTLPADHGTRIVVLRGAGFALALASDVRIAGESARMNAAFIRIAVSACDIGVSYFLPRLVGVSVASELLLTGRFINAARALATGLVSEVVPDQELHAAARRLVDEMLATSPLGLRLTKECLNASVDATSLDHVIAMEDRNQILCTRTDDFREGVAAFLQKREPHYTEG